MSPRSTFITTIAGVEGEVVGRPEYNRLLLSELRYNNYQNIFVSGIFAVFFSQQSASNWVWIWWAGFAFVAAVRTGLLRWLTADGVVEEVQRTVLIYLCIGCTALAWGFAPVACPPHGEEMLFILAISWVALVVIGGAGAFQDDPVATVSLVVPATLPSLLILISRSDRTSFVIMVAIGLIYTHLFVGVVRARRMREVEMRLKAENAKLLAEYEEQAQLASAELERRLDIERELRAARQRAELLSSLDGLTGIANRRSFDEHLETELLRASRAGKPLSVILLDIDCFKAFNDTYGHASGDDCLVEIGTILSTYARRSGDLAARYGGEEFVLVLPATNAEAARQIAENIRSDLTHLMIAHRESNVAPHVTASFGVASLLPNSDSTVRMLIEAADKALYEAKNAGRDRVALAGENLSVTNGICYPAE